MAYKDFSSGTNGHPQAAGAQHLSIQGQTVELPDASFVKDAHMSRDGVNLVLQGPHGAVVVEGYFAADPAPNLVAPGGATLTPELVHSFTTSDAHFASNQSANDVSPVGAVQEVNGHATVTHHDGTVENVVKGTHIFEGDVVETDAKGAVNIVFVDQTSFAVSEDARLAIDKYVFDPSTQSGSTDFSILKGVFVFTSGLIGRDDPDTVKISTPAGSIGIRGTIIAGNVHTGEITVVEGAIVLHDFQGHEITLASQYDTAKFSTTGGGIEHVGQLSANDVGTRFSSVSHVAPTLFSSINDSAHDSGTIVGHGTTDAHGGNDAQQTQPDGHNGPAPADANTMPAPIGPAPSIGNSSGLGSDGSGLGQASLTGTNQVNGSADGTNSMGLKGPAPGVNGAAANTTNAGSTSANADNTGGQSSSHGVQGAEAALAGTMTDPHGPDPHGPTQPSGQPFDPNTGGTTGPTNHAPAHFQAAPDLFFSAVGYNNPGPQHWVYNFSNEFRDQDIPNGDHLTFQLSATSIATLNSHFNDTTGPNIDIFQTAYGSGLDGVGGGNGWSFDTATGKLDLWINPTLDTTQVPVGALYAGLHLNIDAVDQSGLHSGGVNYDFQIYNPQTTAASVYTTSSNIATIITSSVVIMGSNNTLFVASAITDATVSFQHSGGNLGVGNYLHLGVGNNTVTIANDTFNNVIFGNEKEDSFLIANARTNAYGMGGDDTFTIDFTNGGGTLTTDLQNVLPVHLNLDGGLNDFRAGHDLRTLYGLNNVGGELGAGGRGDTLTFNGGGSLDFSTMDPTNKITGIERIDMTVAGNQAVSLRYSDVLNLTDGNHTLVINVGNGDTLNLNGSEFNTANIHQVLNNVSLDDRVQSTMTADMKNYDVFTDGHVTLLIHQDAGGVVNMDGSSVNIAA